MEQHKFTTGGGLSKKDTPKHVKREKKRLAIVAALVTAAAAVGVVFGANSLVTARAAGNTVVDPDTTNVWNQIAASSTSTQNIGRIWTDKSVFDADYQFDSESPLKGQDVKIGESDFLVSLSALSSTSNLKTTTTSTKPLDIVLVVDTSGSMDNDDGHDMGYSYTPTYIVNNNRTYYIQVDGRWTAVDHNNQGWYYGNYSNRTYVDYARYEGDTSGDRVQFYTRSNQQMSRMEALQNAANAFVDSVASMNDNIAETSQQHRISLVKFASDENNSIGNDTNRQGYNYSQVVSDLTAYTTQSASGLKNTINSLQGEGATRADYGMHQAQRVLDGEGSLTGAREEAQKVVIFFTDGNPTTSSNWSNSVAGTAINYAYDMKQDGTLVYSIGVFEDANPSDTGSNFNRYMNAVSSNYPDAECAKNVNVGEWWNPQYEWQQTDDYSDLVLGDREQGAEGEEAPQYYFAATNATELDQVFDDITTSITNTSGSGSPIEEVTHEGALNPGTLTFTDTLGSYMTVSGDTMTVVYGNEKFTSTNKTTLGNVDTYHFEGKVAGNDVYKEADLADLTVTVTHDSNLATGDVVTAQIPASLIPMRNYNVDTNEKTMTVTNAYPIRLFFGVSLKDEAEKAIEQGSGEVYDAIVESNKTDDGNATFYSNLFTSGSGDTTASFTPSDGNKFYYYTSNTDLYLDAQCTQRATSNNIDGHDTLYYSEPYWEITSGTSAQEVTRGIAIENTGQDWDEIEYDRQGNAYIPAGTQRLDRPATLNSNKTENETGTAATVLTPEWDGTAVSQHLGNNGKIAFPLPGELEIKKTVDWGNASDETKQNQNGFTFTVNFNGDETLSGSFAYDVYETGEEPVDNGTVTDGGTITLKDGQRAVIKGLPTRITFTVTEAEANKNGFTTTDTATADPNNNTTDGVASGTIVGGSQQSVSFQNNYKADNPVKLSTKTGLKAKKILTGRDWRASDGFSFQITQIDNGAPTVQMDDPTKIDITQQTNQQTASFGDITFSESGQYRFRVEELSDTDQGITPIAGIDYSGAIYRVTVDVADAGQGALEVTSVLIEQMTNDDGGKGSGEVQGDTMAFTNKYVVGQASETLQGTKLYTDTTGGGNPIDAGKFSFQLEALGGYETGTVEGDAKPGDYTIAADSDAMPKPVGMTGTTLETGNVGDTFQFPTIYFDGNDVGKTFEYRITELPKRYQGNAEPGMTYDTNTSYVVKIVVTEEQDPDSEDQKFVIKAQPSLQPSDIKFTNKYEPTPAKLEGNTAIHGTKTLDGRKMKEGESFYFQLSASNDNAKTVLASPKTVTVSSQDEMGFSFGEMTFTKVGEYVFTVNEVADTNGAEPADGSGMTFDKSIYTVTVNVTDEKDGSLKADVTYKKDDGTPANEAAFTNVYTATHNYGDGAQGGIVVTKMMSGRELLDGEFSFTIKGMDPESEALLANSDRSFTNRAQTVDAYYCMSKLRGITFDQDDAGETFKFIVDEIEPEADMLAGVRYDQSQFEVDITVVDNGDGTMHTVTTVTQTKAQNGDEANEIIVSAEKGDSSKDDYKAPAFGFLNHYEPTPAVVSDDLENALQVTKKVEGAPSPDGVSYTFTLTATNENGHQNDIEGLDENNQITATTSGVIEEDKTQTLNFGELKFTEPGNYDFEVSEVEPAADDGWTYDTDKKTITVSVTAVNPEWTANPDGGAQKYDGHLYIDSVMGNNPTFTNRYQADPVVVGGEDAEDKITVKKSVTGADSTAEFKFKIEPVIDEDHTEKWWIERVSGAEGFNPEVSISGVTQGQAGTVNFGGIVFKAKGVYEFTIAELGAADFNAGENRNGWTYDEHTATVTVTVTDTDYDGKLEAEVSYDNTSATTDADKAESTAVAFTNKYTTTPAVLEGNTALGVQKIVSGADTNDDFTFSATFNASAEDNTGSADNIEGLVDGKLTAAITDAFVDGDTKSADFGTVKFTAPGTYVFDVTEDNTADENSHWTYDGSTHQIKVTVTDNGQGTLVASVDGNDPLFRNTYYNEGEAKDVTSNNGNGSFAGVGNELTYTIDWVNNAVDESGAPVAAQITITDVVPAGTEFVSADNNGSNESGTVTWNLGEKQPGDKGTVSFTVKVTEAAVSAGSVENTATVNIGENNPKQTNTVTTDTPKKTATLPETDTNGIQVGDELTFTIDYLNSSNETGTVTVTDVLPVSLTYVGVPEGAAEPQRDGQTLTWTIEDVEAGKGGTITFTAKVNEKATTVSVDNKATVTVGENTYTSNTTTNGKVPTGELNVSKTVEAIGATVDTQKDFTFNITLTGTDGTPLTGTYTYAVADGAEQDLSFADGSATITLKHGQTAKIVGVPQGATYSVVESPAGTGYSTESEKANGTVSDTAATATFTNTYKPGETPYNPSGTANVAVTKNVTGNGTADQLTKAGYSFQFSVKNVSDGAQPTDGFTMPEDATGTSNADGTVTFNDISFNAVGTYEITVWEIVPADDDTEKPGVQSNNVTYDHHKLVYTLNVTDDDHNGTLDFAVAEDSVSTNENVFTNVFFDEETAKSVTSENAAGDKGDGSMASVGDKLTYTINWVNNAVDENGTPQAATVVVKDTIPEHTTLDESTLNGGEYDAETRTITWTFENQPVGATGTITFTVTVDESAAGTDVQNKATVTVGENDYTTNTVTTTIPGKDVAPAEGDENGIQVGDILTYTIDYANTTDAAATVTVVDTLPDGLTYVDETGDTPTPVIEGQKLTWTIADVPAGTEGELTFTARVNENALTVENPLDNTATIKVGNNTYTTDTTTGEKPETGDLTVSKTVVANGGATIDANKSFSFKIELKDAGGNILTGSYKANVYQGEQQVGTAGFIVSGADNAETTERDETTFTLKHGEHIVISGLPEGATYTVTEAASGAGYVATSENASGTIATEGASAAFTNTYTPGGVTLGDDSAIQVTKKVTGASATEDFTFSIALDKNNEGPEGGVTLPENKTATVTKDNLQLAENANEASASAAFGAISFTKAGTYTFVIDETNADPADGSGWTYDQGVCTVTVRVDNDYATGSLKIGEVQYYDHGAEADAATFTNSYKAGSITTGEDDLAKLQVTKVVTGAPAAEEFTFELRPAEDYGTKVTGLTNGALTVSTNQMTGQSDPQTLTFGDLTFNEEGTYVFNVTETTADAAEDSGWTYDNDAAKQITVVVTDPDKDGKLNATTVVDEKDTNNPTFTNAYVPAEVTVGDDEAGLQVTKNVTGAPATEEFQFTLQLTSDNAAYVKGLGANNSIVKSTTGLTGTQGTETIDFGDLTFTKTGDYTFTVTENTTTDAAGWTYDNAPKTITVHVTDEGFDGQLDAAVEGNDNLTVTNRYESGSTTYDPTGEAGVAVTKVVTGNGTDEQMSAAGYDFTIGVKNVTDPENPTDEGFSLPNPATGTSNTEGTVAFGNITFSKAGDYEVTVSEVNGGKTNVTYDTHSLVYTLHVTDADYDGYLEVAVDEGTVDEGEATFTNVYYDEKDAKDVFDAEDPTTEVDGKLVGVGDTLRYTIDWAATEDGTVSVTDVVPAGTTVVDGSVSQGGVLSEDGRTITWTFENQAFGACGTVSFDVTVDESAATVGEVQNSATITVGDNTYTTNTTKNPVPEKTETSNPDKIGAGTTLSYQISFTNTDGEGATATVVDSLTKGQNYVAGTAKVNGEAMEPAAEGDATTGQTLTWNLSNLAADAEVTITFDVTVTRDAGAEVNNTATVNDHSTNTTTTPYPSDDKKDVFEAEDPTTSVNGKLVGVGDELTYTIDWAADVDGTVTITDTIPAGTELVNNTISDNGSYDEETNTITWSLGEKSMGDKGTVSFNVVVTDAAAENDPVTNTANITVGENDPKVVTATTDIPVKDYEDTTPETGVQIGDVLTYTIEWANDSGQTSDVVITDTLPLGLTYVGVVEGATEPEVSEAEGQQVLTWTLEDQADGAEGTVTFNAMVNEDAITAEDSLHNQATIIVGENDYKTNTTGDEPDDQPRTGSLTVTKTVVAEAGATIDTNKSFSFTLGLKAADGTTALTNEYTAQAYNAEGAPVGPEFTVSNGGTFTLKHGESMVISGLPEGAQYNVTESLSPETDAGYSQASENVTGSVATNGTTAAFTNTYKPGSVSYDPSGEFGVAVNKVVTGNGSTDASGYDFTIAVENVTDGANPADGFTTTSTAATSDAEGNVDFADIAFTQVGDYRITVSEVAGDAEHVTYDGHELSYLLHVTDENHDGKLEFAVDAESYDEADATFTNVYYDEDDAKDVTSDNGDGSMAGVGDKLTYTVDWANNALDQSGDPATATVKVTDVVPAGTTVDADSISEGGVYDEQTRTITWTFENQAFGACGTVSFSVTVDEAAAGTTVTNEANVFVNDAQVTTNPVETVVPGKTATDATPDNGLQVGDVIDFAISYGNATDAAADVTVVDTLPAGLTFVGVTGETAEPTVEGQKLTWTFEGVEPGTTGTITFQARVNENATTVENPVDNTAYVTVGDNTFETNTTGDGEKPQVGNFTVSKTIVPAEGTQIDTNKSFSFTLTLKDTAGNDLTGAYAAQLYAGDEAMGEPASMTSGSTFELKHGQSIKISGLPEGATYSVTEAATDGYTADAATMNGTIPTGEDNASASFTNTYAVTPTTLSGAVNLNVVKNLEGRSWLDTDEFSFVLAADEANPAGATLPEQTELTIAGNTEGHTASFGDITFTQPGTFTFTVTEQPSTIAGVTNDANATRTIVVSVVDNHDGTMTATVDAKNSDDLVFTNTFETTPVTLSGDSAIKVQKTLAGRDWADGETFEFTLAAVSEGAPMPESAELTIDEPTTGSVNTVAFGDMTFTQPGTYVYTISETAGEDATISYDGHTAEVTVAVFQGGNGHDANELWAQVSYDNGTATNEADQAVTGAAAFTNTQGLESKVELTGTKEITGRDFIEGDAFTFTVTGEDDAPMPDGVDEDGNVTINPTEGSKATIDFGAITFAEAGEYVYHVAEAEGTIDGMTYDTARRDVIITVTDDGLGNLSAQITSGADQLAWTNAWAFQCATFAELNGTKTMSGKELKNGQFTFLVQPQDNAPMGDTLPANFNGDATQNEDGTWTAPVSLLSNIAFDEAGDYVYVISEVNDGQPGVTYDGTQYRVTLSVANDGTVSQKIEQSENGTDWTDATAVAFANSYATDDEATLEGAVNLTGTKTLQGRDWLDDDSFTFLLAQTEGNKDAVRMPAETAVVVQGNYSDGAAVPFAFGDIVFTEAGDYAFTISEQQPGSDGFVGNADGMTYDDHVVTISVNVADNGEGKLEATVTGVEGSNSWTNVYKAGGEDKPGILSGAENLVVTKVIEGREWLDTDAFTFTLAADESNPDGVTMPAETTLTINANSENHQAAFGDITFANPGNYKFTVTETAGNIEGMTYDATAHVVEVSVVDNEDGTLTASVISPIVAKDLTFTNTYEPTGEVVVEPTEGEFQLTKVLEGKKWDGDEFTFELTGKMGQAADGALIRPGSDAFPMPDETTVTVSAANGTDASGNDQATFGFGPITYAAAGTYTYEVREAAGDNAGMTYDNHVATVTVTVTDNLHGGYVAAVSISGGEFKNTYHTELDYNAEGKGGLWILKNLENHDISDGQFEFTVTAADDASAAKAGFDGMSKVVKSTAGTVDATAEGKQVATSAAEVFGSMQFTQDDADDTYTYTVAETKGGAEGYTNDETVYTVTITTADDGQGTLEVTTHVVGGSIDQTFVYDNDATTEDAQVVVPFNNSYQASGTFDGDGEGAVRINATKELVNAQMNGGEFTFNVTDAQGNVVSSATNAADGSIDFSAIEFTKDGMLNDAENLLASYEKVDGKDTFTYQYTVSEDTTALPAGVTANVTSFSIKVVVTDNNDGTLSFSVVYPEGTEGLAFKNTYGTTESGAASLNVAGTKTLKTAEPGLTAPDITGSYTFTLTGSEGAPMPEVTTATNDAAGNVTFGEIVYTIENVFADDLLAEDEPVEGEGDATEGEDAAVDAQALEPRSKTFTYTVEESGEVAGVTNDANATRTFTVVVTDNADGTLSVTDGEGNAIQGGLTFDFVNTYSVTPTDPTDPTDPDPTDPSGAAWLTITKALTGRELNEGEFTFALEGIRGTASEGMSLTATNDANGNVTFADGLTFTRPGAYGFTIHEVKGELGGVTYDGAVYTATAQVTDNSDGTLSVTWLGADVDQSPVDAVTFNNTYTVKPTSVVLGGTKVLDGRELSAGEFSFQLADKDGKVIDTAANGEDGTFAFTSVEFDEAGVYEYVISEIVPEDTDAKTAGVQKDNVTYDETSFSVKVTVTDDGQGNLSVSEVTYNGDVKLPVFTNVYVEPEPTPEPEPEQPAKPEEPAKPEKPAEPEKPSKAPLPQAGDGTSAAFATALLAGGAALVAKALALVKRRDD